jgi:hypothetical protein
MSTCKDCIHYKGFCDRKTIPTTSICRFFKDRSKFIELPNALKKGDKLYYICEDTIEGKDAVGELPDIVTAVMAEGFFTSPRTNSDGTFYPNRDQFYYWGAIGDEYFLTKEEAKQALKEREINGNL